MLEFTILMPCLNEERTVEVCVKQAVSWIRCSSVQAEVLIVDNGSSDNSANIAKAAGARVITENKTGYGNALIRGINESYGKYIIIGDCDMSYDFEHLDGYVQKLREGYTFVNGNRFTGGIADGAMPFSHKIGVRALSIIGRMRYSTKIGDFHCGLRGFDAEAARKLNLKSSGMEFATEIIGKFAESKAKMCEIPTALLPDGRGTHSHLRTVQDGLRHVIFMLKPLK